MQGRPAVKRIVMIGAPVTTVRTPPLLEAYFAERGVTATVEPRHLEPDALAAFMAAFRADPGIDGLMVTMPHKRAILPHLDALSSVARRAGGANAVKRLASGALAGAQFDGAALVGALRAAGAPLAEASVLLAGVGGAGLAIAQAIAAHGCRRLAIAETNPAQLAAALADLRDHGADPATADEAAGERFEILINATPLGMRAEDPSPFSEDRIADADWIADIVADPPRTRLAALARGHGRPLVTGRDMVRAQIAPIGRWLSSPEIEQEPPAGDAG